jgi:5'-deoxynucleotidase YfbR-like HD superfamily hydrolase
MITNIKGDMYMKDIQKQIEFINNIQHNVEKMYHLTGTLRYNNQFMLKQENVAEHSYMVVAITHTICETLGIADWAHFEALKYAIIHDIPESITGDIIASTKRAIPGFESIIEDYEMKVIEDHFPFLIMTYRDFHRGSVKLPFTILKLADYISVKLCMIREKTLGNQYQFVNRILQDIDERIKYHYEQLFLLLQRKED